MPTDTRTWHDLEGSRPNILIFLTDSTQIGHLGCYGDPLSITPHLDRLAADGICFTQAYATTPLCHPARSALLTGLYPHANGMLGNDLPGYAVPRLDRTLPTIYTLLHGAGYRCGQVSQHEGLNPLAIDDLCPGYEAFKQRLLAQGILPTGDPISVSGTPVEGRPVAALEQVRDWQYIRDSLSLLEEYMSQDRPWLLSIELDGPHRPCTPSREQWERIAADSFDLPLSLRDPLDDRAPRHCQVRAQSGTLDWDDRRWREAIRLYRAVVAEQDQFLGLVLARLRQAGCQENTLVIFGTDHGDQVGHHGILTKYGPCMDDTILHIPLVMRWPKGIAAGQVQHAFVSAVDLLPTLCALAGCVPPDLCHGHSLVPWLRGQQPAGWREGVVGTFYGDGIRGYTLRSWHDARFKYVFDPYGMDEFYDLATDPGERQNLARRPQVLERVQAYAQRLSVELGKLDDPLVHGSSRTMPRPGNWFSALPT
jgi:choline-sulfatase